MQQARDYFPSQELAEGTVEVYLKAWEEIATKYKMARFEIALWNVLRRSNFFPLPYAIEEECRQTKAMADSLPGSGMKVYECPACMHRMASLGRVEACGHCGAHMMLSYDGKASTDLEMRRFHADLQAFPERFFSVSEAVAEMTVKLAARKAITQ